jgi:hypothetical protein
MMQAGCQDLVLLRAFDEHRPQLNHTIDLVCALREHKTKS